MTNEERKQVVRELLAKGQTLSQIQDYLHKEKNDPITYMELRLLLSEMPDAKLQERERPKTVTPPQSAPPANPAAKSIGAARESESVGSKLSISVDQVPAPGSMLSGYARFSSGAKAHWFLDEMGRLGLEPELGASKPTQKEKWHPSTAGPSRKTLPSSTPPKSSPMHNQNQLAPLPAGGSMA